MVALAREVGSSRSATVSALAGGEVPRSSANLCRLSWIRRALGAFSRASQVGAVLVGGRATRSDRSSDRRHPLARIAYRSVDNYSNAPAWSAAIHSAVARPVGAARSALSLTGCGFSVLHNAPPLA